VCNPLAPQIDKNVGNPHGEKGVGRRWIQVYLSTPGTASTDLRQPSLGWPGRRLHASNHVVVTVVKQGAVGLEKSRVAVGPGKSGEGE
jgi:hypothetical protein